MVFISLKLIVFKILCEFPNFAVFDLFCLIVTELYSFEKGISYSVLFDAVSALFLSF